MSSAATKRVRLGECLDEVTKGVGSSWSSYRLLGATRDGLAAAKESVGKNPARYKLVEPRTIFYNPMRILLGSIAHLEEGEEPGITSPDYVVFRTKHDVMHSHWLYYWLRSADGAAFIRTLTRGAVRERMLFRRLAAAEIDLPPLSAQASFAEAIPFVERARAAAEAQLGLTARLAQALIATQFESAAAAEWPRRRLSALTETCSGLTPNRGRPDYFGGQIPWVKTGELLDGTILRTDECVTEIAVSECGLRVLPPGTLLVAMYGQGKTRGRTGLLGFAGTTNQACFSILPNPVEFSSEFLQLWFRCNTRNSEISQRVGVEISLI